MDGRLGALLRGRSYTVSLYGSQCDLRCDRASCRFSFSGTFAISMGAASSAANFASQLAGVSVGEALLCCTYGLDGVGLLTPGLVEFIHSTD